MKMLRASFFYVADNCDLAVELCAQSGEEPTTEFADKGTRGHGAIAGRIGMESLSAAEAKDVEAIGRKYQHQLGEWLAGDSVSEIVTEAEFIYRVRLKPIYSGHPDKVVFAGPQRAFIPDFKFSWQPLNGLTATNRQLMAYVPLVRQAYPKLEEITTSIIALSNRKNPPAIYGPDEIGRAEIWALSVVKRSTEPGEKKPNAGPWCQYCSGKVLCPIWQNRIPELAAKMDEDLEVVTDEALAQLGPWLDNARKVIDRLQKRLEHRVRQAPGSFPDWRWKPGRLMRKVTDVPRAWALVRDRLTPDEFVAGCDLSIPTLEEAFHKHFRGTRKDSDAALAELLAAVIERKPTKSSLVYDPRPPEEGQVSEMPLPLPDSAGLSPDPARVPGAAQAASQTPGGDESPW